MNPIYRGQYPPTNTDVIWLKDKTAYTFGNDGWAPIDNNSSYSRTQIDDMLKHYGKALSYNEDTGRLSIMNGEEELSHVTIKITLDDTLSETSENGIKNKAVYGQYMTEDDTKQVLEEIGVIDWTDKDFTIQMLTDGTISWNLADMQYSINGEEYQDWDESSSLTVYKNNRISFRSKPDTAKKLLYSNSIVVSGKFNVGGKITSLNGKGSTTQGVAGEGQYQGLLKNNTGLVSAENLILGVVIGGYACAQMFEGCTSLVKIPTISKNSTLNCYYHFYKMFKGCTSLTSVTVNINSLNDYACSEMFANCTSLREMTCPATGIYTNGTQTWLGGVAAYGVFNKAASMASWPSGDSGIPNNWTVQNITE